MAKEEQILRLKYIENFLRIKGDRGATYEEIEQELEGKFQDRDALDMLSFTKRTFQRDKIALENILGVEIKYNRKKRVYHIAKNEIDDQEDNILDNLLLVNAYREIKDKADIMLFEQRTARGLHNLNGLIHAITHQKVISFDYQKFWTDGNIVQKSVEPYALKEFKHRWYLLAKEHQSETFQIKTYGLDRISDLDISSSTFKKQQYNARKAFHNVFGIVSPNGEAPQKIKLYFDTQQAKYIKALPLHHSQREISHTSDASIFEYHLVPTYDFVQELLSYGSRVKVLEPKSLQDIILSELKKNIKQYELKNQK